MSEPSIVYIHGFNSAPDSIKARQLVTALTRLGLADRLRVPALDHQPRQAIVQLEEYVQQLGQPLLVGSSLGGYFATHLTERYGVPSVLINPVVNPHLWDLTAYLKDWVDPGTGEVWAFTQDHIQALAELEVLQLKDPSRYHVWLQTEDEVLDYRLAERFFQASHLDVIPGGDHHFQGFAQRIPTLLQLAGFDPQLWRNADFSDL